MQRTAHKNTQRTHNLHQHGHLALSDIHKGTLFKTDTDDIYRKAKTSLKVIQARTNTIFGQSKEDITLMYKQYIRPILT